MKLLKGLFGGLFGLLFGAFAVFPFLLIVAALVLGTLAAQYDMLVLFHAHIGYFLSFIVGVVTGELSIIVAILLKILALLHLIVA